MFDSIKKWLKRPIVINFTVEPLNPIATINLLKTDHYLSPEMHKAVSNAWRDFAGGQKGVFLEPHLTLEQLSDADLRKIGLIRADFGGDDESQYLDG